MASGKGVIGQRTTESRRERVKWSVKESRFHFGPNASYDNINRKTYEFNLAHYIPISFDDQLCSRSSDENANGTPCIVSVAVVIPFVASLLRAFGCHNIASVCQLINYVCGECFNIIITENILFIFRSILGSAYTSCCCFFTVSTCSANVIDIKWLLVVIQFDFIWFYAVHSWSFDE